MACRLPRSRTALILTLLTQPILDYWQQPPLVAAVSWMTWGTAVPQQAPGAAIEVGAQQEAASASPPVASRAASAPQQATPRSARMPDEQTPVSGSTSWTSRAAAQSPAIA